MTLLGAWATELARVAEGMGIDRLAHADRLLWLVPLALLPLFFASRRRAAISWPAMAEAGAAGAKTRELSPWLGAALRTLALLCLAVVVAEPRLERLLPPEPGQGLDLVLVVDASGSMAAIEPGAGASTDVPRTRLAMAREAVTRFADRRVFAGDRVGLVVFGDTAFTQCPLTSDGALLADALKRVDVGVAGEATALGDALALAVKRVLGADASTSRAIVLLTDGRSNAGEVPVSVATSLAVGESIRVHTVAIGSGGNEVAVESPAGIRFERHDPDPEALRSIAQRTGGRAFAVHRSADLLAVYAAIDATERSERPLPPRHTERPHPEPLLALAGALLAVEIVALRWTARVLP